MFFYFSVTFSIVDHGLQDLLSMLQWLSCISFSVILIVYELILRNEIIPKINFNLINIGGNIFPSSIHYSKKMITYNYPNRLFYKRKKYYIVQNPLIDKSFKFYGHLNEREKFAINNANIVWYTYAIFKNVFVNSFSTCGTKNTYIVPKRQKTTMFSRKRFYKTSGNVIFSCNEFVSVGNQFTNSNFGHCHNDCLLPLMLIPQDVIEKSFVACPSNFSTLIEGLLLIGFKNGSIIYREENDWIYARKFHTIIKPLPFLTYFGTCCRRYHNLISEKLNLTGIPSSKYVFCNREKGLNRHISNMNEIMNLTKGLYPYIEWTVMQDLFPTLKETYIAWSSIHFIFLPTGSNCVKCVAMKPGSVMVVALSDIIDIPIINTVIGCDLFNVWFINPNMPHWQRNGTILGCKINITTTMICIKLGVYAAIHQKWPTNVTF